MILVNQTGKRFWNELDVSYDFFAAAMAYSGDAAKLNGGGPIWAIFDADAVAREGWLPEPPHVDRDGYFFSADTIHELAGKIDNPYQRQDMSGDVLQATVERYNALVLAGTDTDFDKPTPMYPIQTPPFYAAWSTPILHDSLTGLAHHHPCRGVGHSWRDHPRALLRRKIAGRVCPARPGALHGVRPHCRPACGAAEFVRRSAVADQTVQPRVSLAVWDVPTTAVAGQPFAVKAGARSSAGIALHGRRIGVHDGDGNVVASGELGDAPWPGTDALVWTEASVPAPPELGTAAFTVRLSGADLAPPHHDGSFSFQIAAVAPPQHIVVIDVVTQETGAPLGGTEIRLGPYRATTTESGKAELRVATGRYDLRTWKTGYEAPAQSVDVTGNRTVRVESEAIIEENVDRAWKG